MTKLVGSYSIQNLIQSAEFLLEMSKKLNDEIVGLEKNRTEVREKQKEATKQGSLVKKMTSFLSEELERIEEKSSGESKTSSSGISSNIEKLNETEKKLVALRERLTKFIEGEDSESLNIADSSLSIELKQYESFLLGLTTALNEKIAGLEKITDRIMAERRESEQQKVLLKEMVELFSQEIDELDKTLQELK